MAVFVSALCSSNTLTGDNDYYYLSDGFTFKGERRRYKFHIPQKYNPKFPYPLVVFLHGNGGSSSRAAENTRFLKKSDQEGFILAFPEGIKNQDIKLDVSVNAGHSWNAGMCCSSAVKQQVDDVRFIEGVINDLQAR